MLRRSLLKVERPTSSGDTTSTSGLRSDTLDQQPEAERHLEREHWYPHVRHERAPQKPSELQRKGHHEKDRGNIADTRQGNRDCPAPEEQIREQSAAHGEQDCGHIPAGPIDRKSTRLNSSH